MSQITEPLSKRCLFMELHSNLAMMAGLNMIAQHPNVDLQATEEMRAATEAKVVDLYRQALECGLMSELSGYLTATYGG